MGKLIDRIKLIGIKRDFNKIYNLVLENSNRTEKKSFSDGTPYTEAELMKRFSDIILRLNQLEYRPVIELGKFAIISNSAGVLNVGVEKLIQLYDREPVYITDILSLTVTNSNLFSKTDYAQKVNKDMSVDEILDTWFALTAEEIELRGHRNVAEKYGENFIKTYPEFFVEDRNLPKQIKQRFYNGNLTIDDYEKYADEFEGIMVGVGIYDSSDIVDIIGRRNYSEVIKKHSKALNYFSISYNNRLHQRIDEFKGLENIEDILKKFEEIIDDDIARVKKAVLNNRYTITEVRDTEFLRNRLPELMLDDNAPEDLADEYYRKSLILEDLDRNPDWIKWLEGKEKVIKACVLDERIYDEWKNGGVEEHTSEVNSYMSLVYEKEIRQAIIWGQRLNKLVLTPIFRERNKDVFYDDLPKDLKKHFERRDWTFEDVFALSSKKKKLLEGKQIHEAFKYNDESSFCEKYGGDSEAFKIYEKYAGLMDLVISSSNRGFYDDGLEKMIQKRALYELGNTLARISHKKIRYDDRVPEKFINEHSEYFLDKHAPADLKKVFYGKSSKKMTFSYLRNNPEYLEYLIGKSVEQVFDWEHSGFFEFCGEQSEAIRLGIKYGDYVKNLIFNVGETLSKGGEELLINKLYKSIKNNNWEYGDLPEDFKLRYPELFLMDEDIEKLSNLNGDIIGAIKYGFYHKNITFSVLKDYPELKEIMKKKDSCIIHQGKSQAIFDKFTEVTGDREKAFNLITGKFAEKLDKVADSVNFEEDLEKALCYYKEAKFIPEFVVIDKLPKEKIKGFVLNRKLWRKIVSSRSEIDEETIGSLLEAAMVMGVFETREFERDGKTMIQGSGEEGFKSLNELLNYMPRYYMQPFNVEGEAGVEYRGQGYIKRIGDFYEELLYEKIEQFAIECDVLSELLDGELDSDEVDWIMEDLEQNWDECFEEDDEGYFHCIVDRNIDDKTKVMLKTIGIKDDEVLSEEEYKAVDECDRRYIKQAFKEISYVKIEDNQLEEVTEITKYRFNISQLGDKFVIGENYDIDENQSRANKKLFDYIRFLMAEYGLESEAAMLAANNDRSNISLILNQEKMEMICDAANLISQTVLDRYSDKVNIWERKEGVKVEYISNNLIHQLFDGMKMEYNKEFRDFILRNIRIIVENDSLMSRINPIQQQIIEISNDPDYAGMEITPTLVLRAINEVKYSNKKVGFEKGEELAKKFSFNQQYFEVAQELWEEARKRDASIIPRIEGKDNGYSYEVLRLDDVTGIYAGNITNCCQKLGGVGETAMLHSMTEESGRVFIVRDNNKKIVAQSWLWRNGNTICFDNVEIAYSADNKQNQDAIYAILRKVAKELCDKDAEVVDRLVEEGKIDAKKGHLIKAKKVTVGKGYTDIAEIRNNKNKELEDDECKYPMEAGQKYKGVDDEPDELYVSDSREQVVLYKADDYKKGAKELNIAIHCDENIEKKCVELTKSDLKMMRNIEKETEERSDIDTIVGLIEEYEVEAEELKAVIGTDWFMMYSEKDEEITVHKMLKSPSSGIMKKSVREQKEAVDMLLKKGKTISMEFENDRVHRAARSMVRHMQKRYTMKVADEGARLSISEIQGG